MKDQSLARRAKRWLCEKLVPLVKEELDVLSSEEEYVPLKNRKKVAGAVNDMFAHLPPVSPRMKACLSRFVVAQLCSRERPMDAVFDMEAVVVSEAIAQRWYEMIVECGKRMPLGRVVLDQRMHPINLDMAAATLFAATVRGDMGNFGITSSIGDDVLSTMREEIVCWLPEDDSVEVEEVLVLNNRLKICLRFGERELFLEKTGD